MIRYQTTDDMPHAVKRAAGIAERKAAQACEPKERGDVRRRKYRNIPTTIDGLRFDSKKEAAFYSRLKVERDAGSVAYFLRQIPLALPGGSRLVVDFVVFYADGSVRYIDVKGVETAVFKLKRREVEHHYPIKVETV